MIKIGPHIMMGNDCIIIKFFKTRLLIHIPFFYNIENKNRKSCQTKKSGIFCAYL
jgi:hypothetical protein